jgi:hypothetical protein
MITNKAQSAKTHTLQEIPYPNQQIYNNQKIKPFNNVGEINSSKDTWA